MSYAKTQCPTYSKYYAMLYNNTDKSCTALTNGSLTINNFIGNGNDSTIINISYPSYQPYSFQITTMCSGVDSDPVLTIDNKSVNLILSSPKLCAVEINTKSFWTIYSKYKIVFALVFWILGLAFLTIGLKMFSIMLGAIGFLSAEVTLNVYI